MEMQKAKIKQSTPEEAEKVGGPALSDCKTYYKSIAMKII